jgi:integrase
MKNPNGYGCIVYLGDRRCRPWAIRVTEKIEDGKQKRSYVGYYSTQKEAQQALAQYQSAPTTRNRITLSELYDEWNAGHFRRISQKMQENYRTAYKHLEPLYKTVFNEIRTQNIQKIIDEMKTEGKPLSRSSKEKVKGLCSMLYKYAMQNDIAHKDYAQFVVMDKLEKKEKAIFSDLEIKKLFDNDSIPWVDSILVMIYTGMRIQEMLNLTRFDVDWDKKLIRGGLKTEAGKNRLIPIHPKIEKYLRARCTSDKLFPIKQGTYRELRYYPILNQLGIEKKTPHSCRHTFATLLARAKVDTLAIEQLIGHEDYAFTADTYTHTDIDFLTNAILKI